MEKIKKSDRGFIWLNKAYYSQSKADRKPEIMIGIYPDKGIHGIIGEMSMVWEELSKGTPLLSIVCYSDAFHILATFSDLLNSLAKARDEDDYLSEEQAIEILKECGFADLTKYEKPHR